ncbi:hypothetical protein TSUD_205010 [Trifolium subterraneum]|uniref:RNase H type-1 domain-containing protein n=1 Tax=Trifolium subterraneum TaxID=3900 RepID=A0A2Z6NH40_TRISU|nr:hypothetical protein TSUD_205010 [Trifolium subterraneum]
MMNSFWWGHNKEQSKGIHWLSWDRLSMPKNVGGLRFKSISAFNYAMLGKQAWKFMTNPGSLITRLFKARYFPRSDFLQSNIGHNPSYVWRSIWSAKFIVRDGHKWSIGSGHNISIWDQKWLVNGAVISKPPNLAEELHHLNVSDLNITQIWQRCGLWHQIQHSLNTTTSVSGCVLELAQHMAADQFSLFSVLLWSIWQHRNNKLWRNEVESVNVMCDRGINLLTGWNHAQEMKQKQSSIQPTIAGTKWSKPSIGRYKCNIDASFSTILNKVGIGVCIRDDQGSFVLAKTEWFSPITNVDIGEALGLLHAMKWIQDLQLEHVDFELDSQIVVTKFHSKNRDESELGDIIKDCRTMFNTHFRNSRVEFIRRQANEVAHVLAREATSLASFHIFIDVPLCIRDIIMNEME